MKAEVKRLVRVTSVASGAIAVVLSPVPLADELAFLPLYAWMTSRIARHHALPVRGIPVRAIAATTVTALGARAALNVTVSFVPGVAAVANAVTAAVMTQVLGAYVDAACAAPERAKPLSFAELRETLRRRAQ